ncbi:MAG: copper(I)-binding protein [Ilumatobacter sp.]|jgi:copper(I)-binding protein
MDRRRILVSVVAVSALSLGAVACGSDADSSVDTTAPGAGVEVASLIVSDALSREPAEGQTRGVVYLTVANPTDSDITIVSAASSTSDQVELHQTTMADDGVMSMAEVPEGFTVPAGGEFVFEPGGPHIMLLGIDPAEFPTDEVDVTLTLSEGDPISFTAPIEEIGDAMDEMEMDHMDDGSMDEMEESNEG